MVSPLDQVTEFHFAFDLPVRPWPSLIEGDELELRKTLITEEYKEVIEAMEGQDLSHIAKELADLAYVVYGTAAQMGIDLDAVFAAVHKSNMSKLWVCDQCDGAGVIDENGNPNVWGRSDSYECLTCDGRGTYVKYRKDGKVTKSDKYKEPDIESCLR